MADYKTYDINIEQGSTFFLSISLENEEGYVLNIKDCLAIMQIRDVKEDTSKVLLEVTPYLTFTFDNRILVEIPSSVTTGIKWSTGVYDIKVKEKTTGRVYRLVQGSATVDKQVSASVWDGAACYEGDDSCTQIDDTDGGTNTGGGTSGSYIPPTGDI